jgi:RecA-family ATPase
MKKFGNGGYLYNGDEYLGLPEELDWWCYGMVPKKGKTLLIAIAKTAKTIFATQLARDMAKGEPVFSYPTEKCLVLYVILERHIDFRRKLKEITEGIIPDNLKVFEYKKPLLLDVVDTKGYDLLKQVIQDVKPDVVIVDSKYKTTSKKEIDEEALKRWINRFDTLIEEEGCSVIIIHHSPKQEYEELVNRAAGSSILSRWADVIIGIKRVGRDRKDPRRHIEFVSNSGDEPDPIDVEITDTGLEDKSGQVQQGKVYEAYQLLEEDLKKRPDLKITKRLRELAKASNISLRTFWEAWNLLRPN